jgi:hypothetical protein
LMWRIENAASGSLRKVSPHPPPLRQRAASAAAGRAPSAECLCWATAARRHAAFAPRGAPRARRKAASDGAMWLMVSRYAVARVGVNGSGVRLRAHLERRVYFCQRSPHSEPPGSGKLSHPGSPMLSQAGSPILSHPGAAIWSHPMGRDRIPASSPATWTSAGTPWPGTASGRPATEPRRPTLRRRGASVHCPVVSGSWPAVVASQAHHLSDVRLVRSWGEPWHRHVANHPVAQRTHGPPPSGEF